MRVEEVDPADVNEDGVLSLRTILTVPLLWFRQGNLHLTSFIYGWSQFELLNLRHLTLLLQADGIGGGWNVSTTNGPLGPVCRLPRPIYDSGPTHTVLNFFG